MIRLFLNLLKLTFLTQGDSNYIVQTVKKVHVQGNNICSSAVYLKRMHPFRTKLSSQPAYTSFYFYRGSRLHLSWENNFSSVMSERHQLFIH